MQIFARMRANNALFPSIFNSPQLAEAQALFAMWHFACTSIVLYIASHKPFNLFEPVKIPVLAMLPQCILFSMSLLLGNFSLALNSVGFYQLAKIMTGPCVVLLNYLLFRKTVTMLIMSSLALVCIGVGMTNSSAAGTNPIGAVVSIVAFATTAMYQIWIGKKMEDFKVTSAQLLFNQAPLAVLLLIVIVPFSDTIPTFSTVPVHVWVYVVLSGIMAALVNLSQFLIIGRTSVLTVSILLTSRPYETENDELTSLKFNVASNLKTIMILIGAWIGEGKELTLKDVLGCLLAVGGAAWYSQLSR
jgi:solute carrier family 35, member E3